MESCHKKLSVSLSTLAQLSVSFCKTYESEIQPWTTRQAPPPTTLGPLCRRVHLLKTDIDQVQEGKRCLIFWSTFCMAFWLLDPWKCGHPSTLQEVLIYTPLKMWLPHSIRTLCVVPRLAWIVGSNCHVCPVRINETLYKVLQYLNWLWCFILCSFFKLWSR